MDQASLDEAARDHSAALRAVSGGWYGVDLDGTLARYEGWNGGAIGDPVPLMLARVHEWLLMGQKVKIFTARVGMGAGYSEESKRSDNRAFVEEQRGIIEAWCVKHLGQKLEVTATKDFAMVALFDDRCFQVETNTGRIIGEDP